MGRLSNDFSPEGREGLRQAGGDKIALLTVRGGGRWRGQNGLNTRPHPGLLPRGEGESFAGSLDVV